MRTTGPAAMPRPDANALEDLASRISGSVHRPGDAAYAEACAIWNAMIDKRPALVVRPANAEDVATAIAFARDKGLPLSVRGGGHNVAGAALTDGGVTIDMSARRAVEVDAERRIVTVESGATWGDVDRTTQEHGLIVPNGIVSATGVAGFTLGGGFGWTSRKFGFAADNLLEIDVVTADGRIRRASERNDAELFWALRGAGANFGVATSFTFRAHPHGPEALCGMVVHPFDRARDVMRLFQEVTEDAPEELTLLLVLRKAPPAPFIPEAWHGKAIAAIAAHWTGAPEDGVEAMRRIKEAGEPVADNIAPKPFAAFQSMLDGGQPFGRRYYWKPAEAQGLSDGLMDVLEKQAAALTSPFSAILMMHMDGAAARVPVEATAIGIRKFRHVLVFQASWEKPDEDEVHVGWAREGLEAAQPYTSGNAYVNFLTADETASRMGSAYDPAVFARLKELKKRYDPENLFRGSLAIPAG